MGIPCYVIFSKQSGYFFYFFLYLSKFIPESHIGGSSADAHDVRAGTARLPVDASMIEKIRRASENFLTWPDGAPIADGRRR